LTTCIDQAGVYYRVPICCINDPVNYDKDYQELKMRDKKTPDEVMIKGLQIKMNPDKNVKEDVSNLISIKDLKLLYIEKLGE